jgi:hypothetical protein
MNVPLKARVDAKAVADAATEAKAAATKGMA